MNNAILMGLVFGLGLGAVESLIFSEEEGLAKIASDLTMATVILGTVVGVMFAKLPDLKQYLPASAGVGAIFGFLLGQRSGLVLDDTVLLAINGLVLAAFVYFYINKRKPKTQPPAEPPAT